MRAIIPICSHSNFKTKPEPLFGGSKRSAPKGRHCLDMPRVALSNSHLTGERCSDIHEPRCKHRVRRAFQGQFLGDLPQHETTLSPSKQALLKLQFGTILPVLFDFPAPGEAHTPNKAPLGSTSTSAQIPIRHRTPAAA